MVKETLTYTDYSGTERKEDFYFNLTQIEWIRVSAKCGGDIRAFIAKCVRENNLPAMLEFIETLVQTAYGEKSPDGRKFVKSDDILESFIRTEAYNDFVMGLFSDADKAANFFNRLVPKDIKTPIKAPSVISTVE